MNNYEEKLHSYGDAYLLQLQNSYKIGYKFLLPFAWFCVIPSIAILMYGIFVYTNSEDISFIFGLAAIFFAAGALFWFIGQYCKKLAHAVNVEFAKRGLSQYVDENFPTTAKNLKRGLIFLIVVIVLSMCIAFTEDSGTGSGGSVTCRRCGTSYRASHSTGKYIKTHGHCPYCN